MRIIQIAPYPQSSLHIHGGVEASVYGLAQEQGYANEVHVFDIPRIGGERKVVQDGRVMVHRYCNEGNRQFQTIRLVNRMVNDICALSPDVCHVHGTGLFSWQMYRRLRYKKQKVVVTIHGLVCVEKRKMLRKGITLKRVMQFFYQGMVEILFLSRLPFAIVDTVYVKEKVSRYPLCRKPEMFIIPQGINDSYFTIKCSVNSRILLSVGVISERKGHLLTLKAFERVREAGMEIMLVIAGSVADKIYYQKLQRAIEKSNFRNYITLCTDVSDKELKELFQSAHLFVLHTEEESQGIVFAEAMATGMPIVSTIVGGVPYVIEGGVTGLLSEYGNVESFANHMALLMNDDNLWQSFSTSAREASNMYHWSVICKKISEIYKMA